MPDYQLGKIYKIINEDLPDLIYFGSTTQKRLSTRMAGHRCEANTRYPSRSKILFESGTPKIILVEKFPCNDKMELLKRERYYIENNECINKCIPGRIPKEYREDKKEKIKEQKKKYYENNKEKLLERKKVYDQENKEKNKEKRKEQNKIYYQKRKHKKYLECI